MPRDWDAGAYDRLPIPMTGWGSEVVGWLDLAGDERVLDAGCGTGRVTALLRDRLPEGSVVALDGSPAMIRAARERLGTDRIEYVVADLAEPLPIDPVDAILSTATFHWVRDHDRLFRALADVLRPGGQLAAQCGGAGNIASIERALAGLGLQSRKTFATPRDTERRLRAAGFAEVTCRLHAEPTPIPEGDLEPYLEAICLGDLVAERSPADASALVHAVADAMPASEIDYVRLDIRAIR